MNYINTNVLLPNQPKAAGLAYRRDHKSISNIEFINKRNTGNSGVSGFRNKTYLEFSGGN